MKLPIYSKITDLFKNYRFIQKLPIYSKIADLFQVN